MDRFLTICDIVEESISTNVDSYLSAAMDSHINDLREMTNACEAFDVKSSLAQAGNAIKQFATKAGHRIMNLINSIITTVDQLVTRIGNSTHRKEIQVPKDLKVSYDGVVQFIIDASKESVSHVDLMVKSSNLQRLITDPDATTEMMVARAKLMDYNHEVAERLQKLSAETPIKELNDDDWINAKAKGATVPFNPSSAQKTLNEASRYWKGVRIKVQTALRPLANYNTTLITVSKFMKDGEEADNLKKTIGVIRSLVGGTYSATMNLASGMLRGVSILSKTIFAFIAFDKKYNGVKDVVEGEVVEKKEPEKSHGGTDRFKALAEKAGA